MRFDGDLELLESAQQLEVEGLLSDTMDNLNEEKTFFKMRAC